MPVQARSSTDAARSCAVRTRVVVALSLLLAACASAPTPGPFYQVAPAAGAQPGALLRAEPMLAVPAGATATRIAYASTGLDGAPIAVSAVVIVPAGAAPARGRDIIAWAHPTTGVARDCAPSLLPDMYDKVQGLQAMLAQGYVIVATDYPGLGGPGVHPYLVGVSEGRAVLDSVRAARRLADVHTTPRFAVWGHSQGGHAALFAGELARGYAPELELVGVAAAAPATDLAVLLRDDLATSTGKILTALSLWSWSRVYDDALTRVVAADALPSVGRVAGTCLETWGEAYRAAFDVELMPDPFLQGAPFANEPWSGLLATNAPGQASAGAPVFIAQGSADVVVRPDVTAQFVAGLCRRNEKVRMLDMPGVGHMTAAKVSANAAVEWMAARFAGAAPPDDCASRAPVRPVSTR